MPMKYIKYIFSSQGERKRKEEYSYKLYQIQNLEEKEEGKKEKNEEKKKKRQFLKQITSNYKFSEVKGKILINYIKNKFQKKKEKKKKKKKKRRK